LVGLSVAFEVLKGIVEGNAVLLQKGMGFQACGKPQPPLQTGFTDKPFPVGFKGKTFQHTPGEVFSPVFV